MIIVKLESRVQACPNGNSFLRLITVADIEEAESSATITLNGIRPLFVLVSVLPETDPKAKLYMVVFATKQVVYCNGQRPARCVSSRILKEIIRVGIGVGNPNSSAPVCMGIKTRVVAYTKCRRSTKRLGKHTLLSLSQ